MTVRYSSVDDPGDTGADADDRGLAGDAAALDHRQRAHHAVRVGRDQAEPALGEVLRGLVGADRHDAADALAVVVLAEPAVTLGRLRLFRGLHVVAAEAELDLDVGVLPEREADGSADILGGALFGVEA